MTTPELRSVAELAEQCLEQGLIDRYEAGPCVTLQICGEAVHLEPKQAEVVLSTILKELGEGSPNWMLLK